jgi:hypothetical protein
LYGTTAHNFAAAMKRISTRWCLLVYYHLLLWPAGMATEGLKCRWHDNQISPHANAGDITPHARITQLPLHMHWKWCSTALTTQECSPSFACLKKAYIYIPREVEIMWYCGTRLSNFIANPIPKLCVVALSSFKN